MGLVLHISNPLVPLMIHVGMCCQCVCRCQTFTYAFVCQFSHAIVLRNSEISRVVLTFPLSFVYSVADQKEWYPTMDGYVYFSLSVKCTTSGCGYNNLALPTVGQQVCGGHAEWQPGPAWWGQLGDGSDAEEILEDQAGPHQSHGQEGRWVCGGLWCWPGRKAGGGRRGARPLFVTPLVGCPVLSYPTMQIDTCVANDVGDFQSDPIQHAWLVFCIDRRHLFDVPWQRVGSRSSHSFPNGGLGGQWHVSDLLLSLNKAWWRASTRWNDAAIKRKKSGLCILVCANLISFF